MCVKCRLAHTGIAATTKAIVDQGGTQDGAHLGILLALVEAALTAQGQPLTVPTIGIMWGKLASELAKAMKEEHGRDDRP